MFQSLWQILTYATTGPVEKRRQQNTKSLGGNPPHPPIRTSCTIHTYTPYHQVTPYPAPTSNRPPCSVTMAGAATEVGGGGGAAGPERRPVRRRRKRQRQRPRRRGPPTSWPIPTVPPSSPGTRRRTGRDGDRGGSDTSTSVPRYAHRGVPALTTATPPTRSGRGRTRGGWGGGGGRGPI